MDVQWLERERELLPQNPRVLKAFIRSFWPLQQVLARHDDDEIRWPLLVRTQLLRTEAPHVMSALAQDTQLLDRLAVRRFLKNIDKNDEILERVTALVDRHTPKSNRERSLKLTLALGEKGNWTGSLVKHHAYLADRPEIITWKDFRGLVADAQEEEGLGECLQRCILEHAAKQKFAIPVVAHELIRTCTQYHKLKMEDAISSFLSDSVVTAASAAKQAATMIEGIVFSVLPSIGSRLTSDDFDAVLVAFCE
jgi:hypothetical protein